MTSLQKDLGRKPSSSKPRVYILGPMTGRYQFNYGEFHVVGRAIEDNGGIPVSGAHTPDGVPIDPPKQGEEEAHEVYMRVSIRLMLDCTHFVRLRGWQSSTGALLEDKIAKAIGLENGDMFLRGMLKVN